MRHPRQLIVQALRDLRLARALAWRLAVRDISAQYRQAMLGYLWAVLPAVMITVVWAVLNGSTLVRISTGAIPYAVFALTGTVFWQLFVDALNAPLNQLSGNKAMLVQARFPPEALLISGIVQVAFNFLVKLALLACVIAAYRTPVEWTAIFIFVPASAIIVVGTVAGLLLAPLGVLYKDVQQGLIAIVAPLMFLTPVIYPPPATGFLHTVMFYNPLTPLFGVTRHMLFGTGGSWAAEFFSAYSFGSVYCVALVFVLAGWVAFRLVMPLLIERTQA